MNIEYNVSVEDYIAFNLFHFKNSPAIQRQFLIGRLVFGFIIASIIFLPFLVLSKQLLFLALLISVIGGVISFLVYPRINEQSLRKQIPKMLKEGTNDGVIGRQKIILTPEAIINETPAGEQKAFWNSVDKIAVTNNYIFLYVSSMSAAIIPRNVFPNEEQHNAFLELAKQYHHANTGKMLSIISR